MKTTQYFQFRRVQPDRSEIKDSWIEQVLNNPEKTQEQKDGRMRMWAKIDEAGGRYLRIVVLDDNETIHNAFFDRNYRK